MTVIVTGVVSESPPMRNVRGVARMGLPTLGAGIGFAVTVLLLSGCPVDLGLPGLGAGGPAVARLSPPPKPAPKPAPPSKPTTGPTTEEAEAVAAQTPTPQAAALPELPRPELTRPELPRPELPRPETLVGLDEQQTRQLLGAPFAMEDAAPARVWRYANGPCTLDVFFYMDMTSQDFRALSYDLKSSETIPDDERCFATLLARNWTQNWGAGDE